MKHSAPFARAKILLSTIAALMAAPIGPAARRLALADVPAYRSRGHGGRHRPNHAGARKVAWDKRDARKRRNRLRAKGGRP